MLNCYALLSPDKLYFIHKDVEEKSNIISQEKVMNRLLSEKLNMILQNTQQEALTPTTVSIEDQIKQELSNLGYM